MILDFNIYAVRYYVKHQNIKKKALCLHHGADQGRLGMFFSGADAERTIKKLRGIAA